MPAVFVPAADDGWALGCASPVAALAGAAGVATDVYALGKTLFQALAEAERAAVPLLATEDFAGCMGALAALRAPVDAFFEAVLVNAEDPRVRANRYALLARLRGLFLGVADISVLG